MRWAALAAGLFLAGGCAQEAPWGPPPEVWTGVVLIDRTAENEIATEIAGMLNGEGLSESFGAVYEYDIIPYKPIYFTGAGRGRADARELMTKALGMFGGAEGPLEEPRPYQSQDQEFLCAPFNTTGVLGTNPGPNGGLAAMSAVCAWSDERVSGFGLGVAGRAVEEVLEWTAATRLSLSE